MRADRRPARHAGNPTGTTARAANDRDCTTVEHEHRVALGHVEALLVRVDVQIDDAVSLEDGEPEADEPLLPSTSEQQR